MNLVAVETADFAVIHVALHEIVALHAVLVRGKVGELIEVGNAGLECPRTARSRQGDRPGTKPTGQS